MIKPVLQVLGIYLFLMLFVSSISSLFSPKPEEPEKAYFASIGDSEDEETSSNTDDQADSTRYNDIAKSSPTVSPFGFHVNVITNTPESESSIPHFIFSPILKTEPPNILGTLFAELKKRKRFIVRICMRRFHKRQFIPT